MISTGAFTLPHRFNLHFIKQQLPSHSPPHEDGYRILTGSRYVTDGARRSITTSDRTFVDARHQLLRVPLTAYSASRLLHGPYGERFTFTGFSDYKGSPEMIDVVLMADNNAAHHWRVTRFGVLPNEFEDGLRFSDHRLVVATLEWAGAFAALCSCSSCSILTLPIEGPRGIRE